MYYRFSKRTCLVPVVYEPWTPRLRPRTSRATRATHKSREQVSSAGFPFSHLDARCSCSLSCRLFIVQTSSQTAALCLRQGSKVRFEKCIFGGSFLSYCEVIVTFVWAPFLFSLGGTVWKLGYLAIIVDLKSVC